MRCRTHAGPAHTSGMPGTAPPQRSGGKLRTESNRAGPADRAASASRRRLGVAIVLSASAAVSGLVLAASSAASGLLDTSFGTNGLALVSSGDHYEAQGAPLVGSN